MHAFAIHAKLLMEHFKALATIHLANFQSLKMSLSEGHGLFRAWKVLVPHSPNENLITFTLKLTPTLNDAPPNSLIDLNANPKVKTTEKGVRVRSLGRNTFGVEWCVRALGWGLGQVTNMSIIHIDLHKPNNKLVSA